MLLYEEENIVNICPHVKQTKGRVMKYESQESQGLSQAIKYTQKNMVFSIKTSKQALWKEATHEAFYAYISSNFHQYACICSRAPICRCNCQLLVMAMKMPNIVEKL